MRTNDNIGLQATIARNEEIIFSEMGDEMVMMSIDKCEYYGLDSVARRIWEMLAAPQRVSEMCLRLCEEFDVPPDQCHQDVLAFLSRMTALGLLQVSHT